MFNIRLGFEFDKNKNHLSINLIETRNKASAQVEGDNDENNYGGVCCVWLFIFCTYPIGLNFCRLKVVCREINL